MIGGLNVAAIAFALAACALTIAVVKLVGRALHWIEDRWDARVAHPQPDDPQPDEMQQLLTLLCEQLHEQLQQDEPPRAVINLTAGHSHEVSKP
jgi:cytochrome c-type biogenesis protein CcmH/NrfG